MSRPPTAIQLSHAADIVLRFARTAELSDEERTAVELAAHLMGAQALASLRDFEPEVPAR